MRLHPRELEKLMLHYAGDLAKRRKERGIKLNYVESIAYISMEIMEKAREGKMSVAELMSYGKTLLKSDDVLSGVANLIEEVQVEAHFPDGVKLVSVHKPIHALDENIAGEIILSSKDITINSGKDSISLEVINTSDRPVQVGSHFHFFEVNKALDFERDKAYGKRLDIPSGTCVRFEPGEKKSVELIDFGGNERLYGFNDLTNGDIKSNAESALKKVEKFIKG